MNNDIARNSALYKQNKLKEEELNEQRLMRKAYCKANNIQYEEPEEIPEFGQGILKVAVIIVWLFVIGLTLSYLYTR